MTSAATRFIRSHTRLAPVAGLPEITLHLAAEESIDLWEASRELPGGAAAAPPFWAFAWPGGAALARHLLDHPELAAGRRVIDVACGSGVVGIAAALAGAATVVAADVDPLAVLAARLNARVNQVRLRAVVGDVSGLACAPGDLVVAGDVFYDREMAAAMAAAFTAVTATGAEVLVGDPLRSYLPRADLVELASYQLAVDPELEGAATKRAVVSRWQLPRGGCG